jgi:molybdopterin-guanine dinucleotide biosynthesis protein A
VVACDMPFLNLGLIHSMIDQAHDCDVVIPRLNGVLEPLHAVYTRNCISKAEFLIKQNRLSILELYPMVIVKYIETDSINKYDPRHLSFYNINTEEDLQLGKELAGKRILNNDKC